MKYADFDNIDMQEITREAMSYYCPDISTRTPRG